MKAQFDVIIIGAGPAGLECARLLQESSLSVLILERKRVIGPKVCAGGVIETIETFDLPDRKLRSFYREYVVIKKRIHQFSSRIPIHVVDRYALGQYQWGFLKNASNIKMMTETSVNRVEKGRVFTKKEIFGCKYLVGADGANSIVRRFLNLPSQYTIGVYYDIPEIKKQLIFHLNGRSLKTGYIWEFPHQEFTNVGIYYNPRFLRTKNARQELHRYMQKRNYKPQRRAYRAFPIMYLYKGCRFENHVFLAGEAAGLASKLTGEGISYAMISGREIARRILNPGYAMPNLARVLKSKQRQERLLDYFERIPAAGLNLCFSLLLKAVKLKLLRVL
jgi:geranylgeranyl reductase